MLPQIILGIPAGSLSDTLGTRRTLIASNLLSAALALILAAVVGQPASPIGLLYVGSAISGILDAPRTAASQAFAVEVAGDQARTSALSLANLAAHVGAIVAAIGGGLVIASAGVPLAFVFIGVGHFAAALLVATLQRGQERPRARAVEADIIRHDARPNEVLSATRRMLSIAKVRWFALSAAIIEVFAFSSIALLPAFADEVFLWGAAGLGWMLGVRSVGAVGGILAVPLLRTRLGGGRLLLGLAAAFGLSLVVFALSQTAGVALLMLAVGGFAGAAVDTLIQALLQESVPGTSRGAAMGVWVTAIGLAPVGQLQIGFLATAIGAPLAQAVNGIIVICAVGLLTVATPLRRLR
jgi:MFS family permease